MNEDIKIKKHNNSKLFGYLEVEFESVVYKIMYNIDEKEEWHFFYENGKKPKLIDFEYMLMCNL